MVKTYQQAVGMSREKSGTCGQDTHSPGMGHEDPSSLCFPSSLSAIPGQIAGTSIATTEIYRHVAVGEHGLGVESPLDRLEG